MQLSLFSLPTEVVSAVLWCRPAGGCVSLFVVGFASPVAPSVLAWLAPFVQAHAVLPSGSVGFLVQIPGSLSFAFRSLPSPRGGSWHESNQLPW